MHLRRLSPSTLPFAALAGLLALLAAHADPPAPRAGEYQTAFSTFMPLAEGGELARRSMDQIDYAALAAQNGLPSGPLVDPAKERWDVYIPGSYDGSEPYGVLVWVHPGDRADLPYRWNIALDDHKLIYVSAFNSGNERVAYRRMALALTGLANVIAQYKVDRSRIYVGGFSGGGRIASRLAAEYAEVFSGAIYVEGGDGVGGEYVPVPPVDDLALMRGRGRYFFTVGDEDPINGHVNERAYDAYRQLCIPRVRMLRLQHEPHENLERRNFVRALDYLDDPQEVNADEQDRCLKGLDALRQEAITAVQQAVDSGDAAAARERLIALDRQYGPLAEPDLSRFAACLAPGGTLGNCAKSAPH